MTAGEHGHRHDCRIDRRPQGGPGVLRGMFSPRNRFITPVAILAALGGPLSGYGTGAVGGAAPPIKRGGPSGQAACPPSAASGSPALPMARMEAMAVATSRG